MRRMIIRVLLATACLPVTPLPAAAVTPLPAASHNGDNPADWHACRAAIRLAEQGTQIPPQLLAAIGRVESGRRNPETGSFSPWPWTINAEGVGKYFRTKAEAVAEVRQLQARGVRSIDVGCMQISLLHHPAAFPSLEAAFDPVTNARYAAKFLQELQAARNNWTQSAANYHSNTAEFALAYQRRIQAAWPEETRIATTDQRDAAQANWASARAQGFYVPGGAPMVNNGPVQRTTGLTGRGLDSYRSLPVMPARVGPFVARRI